MAVFYKAPEVNFWSTTLNGDINDSVDTITLTSVANLQAPGCIVIDREDGSGVAIPGSREIITFTGISGSDLTGCTRGAMNSTARAHTDGALVEAVMGVDYWNDLRSIFEGEHNIDGSHKPMLTVVTTHSPNAGATEDLNLSLGNIHLVNMPGGNITLTCSNETIGQVFLVEILQDGTGSRTVTWFSTIKWADGATPALTKTASKKDSFIFRVTGTDTYDGYIVGQNI